MKEVKGWFSTTSQFWIFVGSTITDKGPRDLQLRLCYVKRITVNMAEKKNKS